MRRLLLLFLMGSLLSGCAHSNNGIQGVNSGSFSGLDYSEYQRLYFSGQPEISQFKDVKNHGIGVVVNMRDPNENPSLIAQEAKILNELNLTYYNIPVSGSFEAKGIARLEAVLAKHHEKEKILIHCGSGQRATAFFAIHMIQKHNKSTKEALNLAKSLGLSSGHWEKAAKDYVDQ